ncbi:MAG: nucleotidyltransferase domain-containing protein [Thermodesulfobacteriota bacterium]|nr:nucleotidyltransferase domain-containing protein [Thermodesulfobacteriota bacterium]
MIHLHKWGIRNGKNCFKKIDRVDDSLLREIRDRIVEAVKPERIILFGSYAYGKPKDGSDLDILVVMNSELPR